jgi:hypothetical protein
MRPVAGSPVRRALVALDLTGKQFWHRSDAVQRAADSGRVPGRKMTRSGHRKKVLTGFGWFGILGEFA